MDSSGEVARPRPRGAVLRALARARRSGRRWQGGFVLEVRLDNPMVYPFLRAVLERIAAFAVRYDHGSVKGLVQAFVSSVTAPVFDHGPVMRCWIAVADGQVVGHVLVGVAEDFGARHLSIMQYEADVALPSDVTWIAMEEIREWGRTVGINRLRALTRSELHARAFEVRHGVATRRMQVVEASI